MNFSSFPQPFSAVVIGASGGLGAAFVRALAASSDVRSVLALSRSGAAFEGEKIATGAIDVTDEASIAAAAALAPADLRLVIVAVGLLHDGPGFQPEKRLADLDPAKLARAFAINTIGPALCVKHFAPLLPREGKAVIAALSAKVGSIADNRLGGWTGYRASKAALNMALKNAAIELAAKRRDQIVLALHPGTVETPLSHPFHGNVAREKLFTPDYSAEKLLGLIEAATPADSGALIAWDGERLAY